MLWLDVMTCSPYVLHVHHSDVYNSLTVNFNTEIKAHYMNILTKIASDSISEHLFFKIFLGGMPPDPLALAYYACCMIVLCTMQLIPLSPSFHMLFF